MVVAVSLGVGVAVSDGVGVAVSVTVGVDVAVTVGVAVGVDPPPPGGWVRVGIADPDAIPGAGRVDWPAALEPLVPGAGREAEACDTDDTLDAGVLG